MSKPTRKFVEQIAALASAFGKEADSATYLGYWIALSDVPHERIEHAVVRAIRGNRFMPTASELRQLTGELTIQSRCVLAWESFEKAVVSFGGYRSVDFDDPVINATVNNLGGWERLCEMPPEEFSKWLRKDFERVYVNLCESGVSRESASPLIGTHDRENGYRGYEIQPPVKVVTGLPCHDRDPIRIGVDRVRNPELPKVELKKIENHK